MPAVLVVSAFTGEKVELGLTDLGILLLAMTVVISAINVSSRRTNVLQGVVHLVLFSAFLVLIFD